MLAKCEIRIVAGFARTTAVPRDWEERAKRRIKENGVAHYCDATGDGASSKGGFIERNKRLTHYEQSTGTNRTFQEDSPRFL